jgi:hypothetical protein
MISVYQGISGNNLFTTEESDQIRDEYLTLAGTRYSKTMFLKKKYNTSYILIGHVLNGRKDTNTYTEID